MTLRPSEVCAIAADPRLPSPDHESQQRALTSGFEKLSVFYPMWNEEDYIERALTFGRRACEDLDRSAATSVDYELIVIDDKSTDARPRSPIDWRRRTHGSG